MSVDDIQYTCFSNREYLSKEKGKYVADLLQTIMAGKQLTLKRVSAESRVSEDVLRKLLKSHSISNRTLNLLKKWAQLYRRK